MQVILSMNSWHYRLQRWVLGYNSEFTNLCPYFWLTIFCLLVAVPVGVCKLLWGPFQFLATCVSDQCHRFLDFLDHRVVLKSESLARNIDDATIYYYLMVMNHKIPSKFSFYEQVKAIIFAWRDSFESDAWVEEEGRITREQSDLFWKNYKARQEFQAERKKKLMRIAKATQKFFMIVGIACGLAGALFVICMAILAFIARPLLGAGITIFLLVGLLAALLLERNYGNHTLGSLMTAVGERVGSKTSIFSAYFQAVKKKACPSIDWKA